MMNEVGRVLVDDVCGPGERAGPGLLYSKAKHHRGARGTGLRGRLHDQTAGDPNTNLIRVMPAKGGTRAAHAAPHTTWPPIH